MASEKAFFREKDEVVEKIGIVVAEDVSDRVARQLVDELGAVVRTLTVGPSVAVPRAERCSLEAIC